MREVGSSLEEQIQIVKDDFLKKIKQKEVIVVSHFDTDGITSAAIMTKALKKLDCKFSVKIVKSLDEDFIMNLPKNKTILFLDLASGSFEYIKNAGFENVFIIDHHEITSNIPGEFQVINPELYDKQKISASGLTYLFCKEINPQNKEFAKLAILGMIGDMLEKELDQLNHGILQDGEVKRKRGLLIYPSTRPLNRTLEYSSQPFIPGVTGDIKGVLELLREIGLTPEGGKYKSLIELSGSEMEKLVTAVMLRNPKVKNEEIVGDLYLIKLFNKLEDAREISAKINACSRYGESGLALQYCLELDKAKKKVESVHIKHKQNLISGLKYANETEKIEGNGYIILNAMDNIQDTIIGTIASIFSNSRLYKEGTVILTMARYDDKTKISVRNSGRTGENLREILAKIIEPLNGEIGGHKHAAGGIISQEQEQEFIQAFQNNFSTNPLPVSN